MKPTNIYNETVNGSQPKVENAEQANANNQSQQHTSQYEHRAVLLGKIKGLIVWAYDSSNPKDSFTNNKN